MIPADLAQALLLAVVPVAWWAGALTVPLLAGVAFLAGTAALCFGVVGFSYVPELVDAGDLAAANRAIQGSRTVTEVAGPGVAGLLVGAIGAPTAMAVDALSYLASALGVWRAHPRAGRPSTEDARRTTGRPRLWDGLRLLFTDPYLRPLTLHAALYNLADQVFLLNLVLWAVRGQHVTTTAYGLALGAAGVGALVGTVGALALARRLGLGRAFVASLVLSCGVPVLATLWSLTGPALAVLLAGVMLVSGVGLGNANVYSLTLRQTVIPKDQLTRSAGAYTQVMYGSIPIGGVLAGVLGEQLGPRWAALAGAVLLAVSIVPMLTRPVLSLGDLEALDAEGDRDAR